MCDVMRCFIAVLFAMMFGCMDVEAQKTQIRDVFVQMPDTMIAYLSENNKLDLIDFIDSEMKAEVENGLEGNTVLEILTPDYLLLRLTPVSMAEMRLLPSNPSAENADGEVLCMVRTYGDSVKESTIEFYTTQWKPVERMTEMTCGNVAAWCHSDSVALRGDDDFVFVSAKLSPADNVLDVTMSIPFSFEGEAVKPKERIVSTTLKWDGFSFK